MVDQGLVQRIVVLVSEKEQLSEFSLEYSLALLMNLSLSYIGRLACSRSETTVGKGKKARTISIVEILAGLCDHANEQVNTTYDVFMTRYVHM